MNAKSSIITLSVVIIHKMENTYMTYTDKIAQGLSRKWEDFQL